MKSKNIPADVKSKSIKEAKDEINVILSKLEKNDADLQASMEDYKRLIYLNNHVDRLFKDRVKEISIKNKETKKND
jgi:exonuclease VII small subunit